MRRILCGLIAVALLAGCEGQQFRARERGALAGTAAGAGLGAIVGHETGKTGAGVAIGAAAGAIAGALIGNEVDRQDDQIANTESQIAENQRILQENQRIIDELKRRGADVRSTDRGVVVNLPDVLFDFDKATLTRDAERTIADIADVLQDVRARRISVEGHTDSVGTIAYNQSLSERRSKSVAASLVRQGVSRRRVVTRGFGESDPIASNRTERGRARNRRVEVIIENF
jgi:outer membrane protein OmpA-like peptidoglycan-associated protein